MTSGRAADYLALLQGPTIVVTVNGIHRHPCHPPPHRNDIRPVVSPGSSGPRLPSDTPTLPVVRASPHGTAPCSRFRLVDGIFRVSMSALAVRRAGWVRRAFALRPYRKHLSVGRRHPSRGDPPPRNPNHRFPWGSRASLALLPHSGLCFPMAGLHCFALVRPSPQAPRPCSASRWQACSASPWGARRGWSPRRDVVRRAMNAGRNTCVRCGTDSRGSAVSGL